MKTLNSYIFLGCLLTILYLDNRHFYIPITSKIDTVTIVNNIPEFELNEESVYKLLLKEGVKYPKIVLKQALLETNKFKSNVCLNNKNIFGLRRKSYLNFDSYSDCIRFYAKWQKKYYKSGDYYQFLKKYGYAEDSLYTNKLKNVKICIK